MASPILDQNGNPISSRPLALGDNVIPLRRSFMADALSNVMSGMGTTADRRSYAGYNFTVETPQQVEASYRTSWLMRKIVDIPVIDMTRAWRAWQTEREIIAKLEKEEKRLQLRAKLKRALTLARLWGGGALFMGVKGQGDDPMQPLNVDAVKLGGLEWMHVFARHQITVGNMIADPLSPWFGQPEKYTLSAVNGKSVDVHPSRVIPFIGQPAPEGSMLQVDWFWGDPIYQTIKNAIQNADLAQDGFAGLIDEAKVDIVKMPDLMEKWATTEYEGRLLARLASAKMGKSNWRTLLLDSNEEWDQRETSWTGVPDVIVTFLQMVSGAADIPVTRLLGQSPKGLNSTGEGEEKDYHAMIEARQDEMLAPALDRIDELLIRSALGSRPEEIWYRFNPLMRLSPKDASAIEAQRATTVKTYVDSGLIEPDALSAIAKNAISESGQWPGADEAFDAAEMQATGLQPPPENDPKAVAAMMTPAELAAAAQDGPRRIADGRFMDATPRSLYVSRKLLNAAELIKWAKGQGFATIQTADQMHVTVALSRKPVDWMTIGEDWSSDELGRLKVKPGGARVVEPLGDKGAIVLLFRNDSLEYRHRSIHDETTGAQWDFPEYQPHVTITWDAGNVDLETVEAYQGPLVFGPEIFAEVIDDWEKTIEES